MKLSGPMSALRSRLGDEKTLIKMARAGFDAVDYTFNEMVQRECIWNTPKRYAYAKELLHIAHNEGIVFNQAHMPFLFDWDTIPINSAGLGKSIYPLSESTFELCDILEIPQIIVHPLHHITYLGNEKKLWDWNISYYQDLSKIAQKYHVKIALENMWQYNETLGKNSSDFFSIPQQYKDFYDALHDPKIVACVDCGHAGLAGEDPAQLLLMLGKRVKALHVHDNRGLSDDHTLPYLGTINWESVTDALAQIQYDGDLTFEVTNYFNTFQDDFLDVALKFEVQIGRYLIDKIEGKKRAIQTQKSGLTS